MVDNESLDKSTPHHVTEEVRVQQTSKHQQRLFCLFKHDFYRPVLLETPDFLHREHCLGSGLFETLMMVKVNRQTLRA